jgi:hypothetical protein
MSLDAMTKQAIQGYATPEEALATQQKLRSTALQSLQGNLSPEEQEQQKYVQERRAGLSDKQRRAEKMNEALAFLEFGGTPGGLGTAAIAGGKKYIIGQGEIQKTYDELNDNLVKQAADLKRAQRQEANGNAAGAEASREKAVAHGLKAAETKATLANQLQIAQGNNAATLGAASINASTHGLAFKSVAEEKAAIANDLEKQLGRPPTKVEVLTAYTNATKQGDESIAAQNIRANNLAYNKFLEDLPYNPLIQKDLQKAIKGDEDALARVEAFKQKRRAEIYSATPTQTAPPAQNNSLTMDGYAFPDQKSLDAYKEAKAKKGK